MGMGMVLVITLVLVSMLASADENWFGTSVKANLCQAASRRPGSNLDADGRGARMMEVVVGIHGEPEKEGEEKIVFRWLDPLHQGGHQGQAGTGVKGRGVRSESKTERGGPP